MIAGITVCFYLIDCRLRFIGDVVVEGAAGVEMKVCKDGGVVRLARGVRLPIQIGVAQPVIVLCVQGTVGPDPDSSAEKRRPESKLKGPSLLQTIKGLRTLDVQLQSQNPHLSRSHVAENNLNFVVKLIRRFRFSL